MLMLSRMLHTITRLRFTLTYTAVLVSIATALFVLGPQVQNQLVSHISTNLHNLQKGHFGTLVASAFVSGGGPIWVWLPGLVCLLALGELLWRSGRLVLTFALGHVGATLIVAGGLFAAIRFGWLPLTVEHASDVGMSYGAAAVLGALTAAIPVRLRPAWIGWWLAVGLVAVTTADDFTAGGHFVALVLGMLLSIGYRSAAGWSRGRYALLGVGVSFGYLVLVNTEVSLIGAPLAGALGALTAHWLAVRRRVRDVPDAPVTQKPVLTG